MDYNTLKKNDVSKLLIEDLTIEGAGIGRILGLAVFVPKALPGESVTVKIIKITKSYAVARLMQINETSPHRAVPFCGVFEQCGGCTLQHLGYAEQLAFKQRHIMSCFSRIGGIDITEPDVLPCDNTHAYRNKASFPVANVDGTIAAGFYAPRSHDVVASDCPIQKPQINTVKNAVIDWAKKEGIQAYDEKTQTGILRHIIGRYTLDGQIMAGIVVRKMPKTDALVSSLKEIDGIVSIVVNINNKNTNAIFGDESRVIFGDEFITENYDGLSFQVGLKSFLQVNHPQSSRLYELALGFAEIKPQDIVFDLFCGIGTISLLAAKRAKQVVGIEYVSDAIENAVSNAKLNGINNATFIVGDAAARFDEAIKKSGQPDIVILDPPRKGCSSALITRLIAAAPKRIVYVSCNPSTLARDAALFTHGGYFAKRVRGVDMFPHTTHVECCLLLELKE